MKFTRSLGYKVARPDVWIDQNREQNLDSHMLTFNSELRNEILDTEDHLL